MTNHHQRSDEAPARHVQGRTKGFAAAAVVALSVVGLTGWRRVHVWLFAPNGMAVIAQAMDGVDYRLIEPQLSGNFPYRTLWRMTRGSAAPARLLLDPQTLGDLHARGVLQLIRGNPSQAVPLLERALEEREGRFDLDSASSPEILTNLAAAYYERAIKERQPLDLTKACSASSRAVEIAPQAGAGWNVYALVLENLHLRQDAIEAWNSYLAVDGGSEWAVEARRHLDALKKPSVRSADLVDAAEHANVARVREIVDDAPQNARISVEEVMLGDWADAVLRNDFDKAHSIASAAMIIGRELIENGRDGTAYDAAVQASRASGVKAAALARACRSYRDARKAYSRSSDGPVRTAMLEATRLLGEVDSPLQSRAAVFMATMTHYAGDNQEALLILRRTLDSLRGHENRYPLVVAQALWARGHTLFVLGLPHQSLLAYAESRQYMLRAGEASNIAGIEGVTAETYRYLGDTENAWLHYLLALRAMSEDTMYLRRQAGTADAAMAALEAGQGRLAALLARRVALNARAEKDPVFESEALWNMAVIDRKRGRTAEASAQLQRAAALLEHTAPDPSMAPLYVDVAIERGELLTPTNPSAAISLLAEAKERLVSLERHTRMPRLYLASSRAHRALGDLDGAERELRAGVAELEKQRCGFGADEERSTFTDTVRALYDDLVQLLVEGDRTDAALDVVRRARMSGLPAFPPGGDDLRPAHEALIEYYVLPQSLLTWTTVRGERRFDRRDIVANELASTVDDAVEKIASCERRVDCARPAELLYDLLVTPVARMIASDEQIVIAPDSALHRVPFAALMNPRSRRYLVEEHAVTIGVGGGRPAVTDESYRSILVAAAPSPPGELARLDAVKAEARHAARAFGRSLVLNDAEATAGHFLEAAGEFDVVHFAGHATSNDRQPRLAVLHFAASVERPDGALYAYEIPPRHLARTRLLVLAACGTAHGHLAGSGLLGFTRTFIVAGVPRVVGTLWSVDDNNSASLFADFYRSLAGGGNASAALRDAQRAAIASSSSDRPQTWAAYQLYVSF
jgi:CHAT domain-containing protein/tetratricopeptide (TPR) repeat protein